MSDDPSAPDVHLTFIVSAVHYFRGHIARCTAWKIFFLSRSKFFCKTKVSNLNVDIVHIFTVKQDILQFKVSMHYPLAVKVAQAEQDLVNYEASLLFAKRLTSFETVIKLTSLNEFCYNIDMVLILEKFIDAHQVRMCNALQCCDLILH